MALAIEDIQDVDGSTPPARPARPARRPTRSARRPGRWVHKALLTAHVLSAVGWFGVAVMVAFTGIVGSANDELALYELIRTSLWLTVPLGLTAAATGVALSLTTRWGLVRYWWVVLKELGTVAVILTDVLIVAPEMAHAVDTRTVTELPGPVIAHCVVLAIATVLSVVKPRPRTPFAR